MSDALLVYFFQAIEMFSEEVNMVRCFSNKGGKFYSEKNLVSSVSACTSTIEEENLWIEFLITTQNALLIIHLIRSINNKSTYEKIDISTTSHTFTRCGMLQQNMSEKCNPINIPLHHFAKQS